MGNSVDRLIKNLCNARKSWETWCFMSGFDNQLKQSNREINKMADNNPLLFHLRYLALKDLHIELYKVLKQSKWNGDNLFYLLEKRIKSNPKNKEELLIAQNNLENMKLQIKSICDVRDKFYAHLDKDYDSFLKNNISLNDIHNIFFEVESAIVILASKEKLQTELNNIQSRMDFSFDGIYFQK
jgi:hypothetical protein